MAEPTVLMDDLTFPEGPRWHRGRLWFSDFYDRRVVALALDGTTETVARVPCQPSGLGFDPQGRLLIVSMTDRKLLRREGDLLVDHAHLTPYSRHFCNDMVVDAEGGAYVGNFGFDRHAGERPRKTTLIRVEPDGTASIAAEDLFFPNGTVITPDGRTLIIAETWGRCLTAFDRDAAGRLSNRRIFADLGSNVPDGICLDAEGAVWVADPRNNEVIRVHAGGAVSRRIDCGERGAYACMLGGADRRTLFICTNTTSGLPAAIARAGRIESIQVDVPGAGLP